MLSELFLKFMYSMSVSKYRVTVYMLDLTLPMFALVKIKTNQTTVNLNACPEIAP